MGDRTWMDVTVRRDCLATFLEASGLGDEDYDDSTPWVEIHVEEVNYGGSNENEAAAMAGCVFYGSHGSGGGYGPYDFYSTGDGVLHQWETGHDAGHVVTVGGDGVVDKYALNSLRAFVQGYRALWDAATTTEPEVPS